MTSQSVLENHYMVVHGLNKDKDKDKVEQKLICFPNFIIGYFFHFCDIFFMGGSPELV